MASCPSTGSICIPGGCLPSSPATSSQLRDGFNSQRLLESARQRFAVHVLPHRQTEEREDGRADVQQARAVNPFILPYARPPQGDNAVVAMLDGRTRRLAGNVSRAEVIGVEAMVGEDNHGGLRAGQPDEYAQHHVVEAVPGLDHALGS